MSRLRPLSRILIPFICLIPCLSVLGAQSARAESSSSAQETISQSAREQGLLSAESTPDGRVHFRFDDQAIDRAYARAQARGYTASRDDFRLFLEDPIFTIDDYVHAIQVYHPEIVGIPLQTLGMLRIGNPHLGCVFDLFVTSWLLGSTCAQIDSQHELNNWGGAIEELKDAALDNAVSCALSFFPLVGQIKLAIDLGKDFGEWWEENGNRWGINNQIEFYRIYRQSFGEEDPFSSIFVDDFGYLIPPQGYGYLQAAHPADMDEWPPETVRALAEGTYAHYFEFLNDIMANESAMATAVYEKLQPALDAIDEYRSGALNEAVITSEYSAYLSNLGRHALQGVRLRNFRTWPLEDQVSELIPELGPGCALLLSTEFPLADVDQMEFVLFGEQIELPIDTVLRPFAPGLTLVTATADSHPGFAPETVDGRLVVLPLGGNYHYIVDFGDGSPTFEGTSDGTNVFWTHLYAQPGDYDQTATVGDGSGAFETITQSVSVSNPVTAVFPLTNADTSVLPGTEVNFSAGGSTCQTGCTLAFEWDFDYDGDSFHTEDVSADVPRYFTQIGSATVALRVSSPDGISDMQTQTIQVRNPVHPYFTAEYEAVGDEVDVTFDALPEGLFMSYSEIGSLWSFAWDFGDGTSGSDSSVTHPYPFDQAFLVRLTVTDSQGYSASYERELMLSECGFVGPPADCHASQDRWDGVLVQWTCLGSGMRGFKIERDGQLVHWGADPMESEWLDAGLIAGEYHYRVYAYGDYGNGPAAEVVGRQPGTNWSGYVTSSTTWTISGSPHFVTGGVTVVSQSNPTLTIEPGVIVRFAPGTYLTIGVPGWYGGPGTLRAMGTADSVITFTALSGQPGDWYGIHIENGGNSVLGFCTVEKATTGIQTDYFPQLAIHNCVVRDCSGTGMAVSGEITECTVTGNGQGGLRVRGARLERCEITGNAGFGIAVDQGCEIDSSTISSNAGDGIQIANYGGSVTNSTIAGNAGASIRLIEGGGPVSLSANTYTGNTIEAVAIPAGGVLYNSVWPSDGLPYLIEGDVTVANQANPLLTIQPGALIRFAPGASLQVGGSDAWGYWIPGRIGAIGTSDSLITFTPVSGEIGGWDGIHFMTASPCSLEHCLIEKASNGVGANTCSPTMRLCSITGSDGFGLNMQYSSMDIDNCSFTDNRNGNIYAIYSTATISNCILGFSANGFGVYAWGGGLPALSCCDIWENASGNYGGDLLDQTGLDGNFSADPLFCDRPGGDLHLQAGSPCVEVAGCGLVGALGLGCVSSQIESTNDPVLEVALLANCPNPFQASTLLRFEIPEPGASVSLTIYDVMGRRVRSLIDSEHLAGRRACLWEGRDALGRSVASGIYFCSLHTGREIRTQTMLLVR